MQPSTPLGPDQVNVLLLLCIIIERWATDEILTPATTG
jgi:hypothetical protein